MHDFEVLLGRPRGRTWHHVGYGVYRRGAPAVGGGRLADLHAWQQVLAPEGFFTHLTAAEALGLWLPPLPEGMPVCVSLPQGTDRPRRAGMRVTRLSRTVPPILLDGLRVAPPAEVILACARDLGLLDLVVLIDSALRAGWCTVEDLRAVAAPRRRGAPALRIALAMADARSESPWESLLRLFHFVCDVEVEPQFEVRDEHGAFVARGDLWLRGTTTLHEYDGAVHRDRRTHVNDLARDRRLAGLGWTRRGYTAVDLLDRARQMLREADAALGRAHVPSRLDRWWALLDESLFTARGRQRLARRWGLEPH